MNVDDDYSTVIRVLVCFVSNIRYQFVYIVLMKPSPHARTPHTAVWFRLPQSRLLKRSSRAWHRAYRSYIPNVFWRIVSLYVIYTFTHTHTHIYVHIWIAVSKCRSQNTCFYSNTKNLFRRIWWWKEKKIDFGWPLRH